MKELMMKKVEKGSTCFLRAVVFAMGAVALFLGYLILPAIYGGWEQEYPDFAYLKYPFLIGLASTMIPFFIALWQTLKLLSYVDANKAFSELSVKSLRVIKHCAGVFSLLYVLCLPLFYIIAQSVDAPGVMVIGLIMSFAPMVIAVFAAVLQKLLQSAIAIKSENDLTV
jgi:hypothetical protein